MYNYKIIKLLIFFTLHCNYFEMHNIVVFVRESLKMLILHDL
jgi:hypothetical protein